MEQYFVQVSLKARGKLDIEILGAWCDVKNRALRFNALVLDSVKLGVLEKARSLLQHSSGSARAGGIGTGASSGAGAMAGSEGDGPGEGKQECSLCRSTAHGYGEKHVGQKHLATLVTASPSFALLC